MLVYKENSEFGELLLQIANFLLVSGETASFPRTELTDLATGWQKPIRLLHSPSLSLMKAGMLTLIGKYCTWCGSLEFARGRSDLQGSR